MNRKIISKVLLAVMGISMLSFGAINSNTSAHTTLSATNAPGINASTGTTASIGATSTAAPTGSPTNVVPTQTPPITDRMWLDESRTKTSGKYTYHIVSREKKLATILEVKKPKKVVSFPKKIDGYRVIGLGCVDKFPDELDFAEAEIDYESSAVYSRVFGSNKDGEVKKVKVRKVIIPSNIRFIGDIAFEGCHKLETVKFEKRKKKLHIYGDAFLECKSLKYLKIPEKVVLKGDFIFKRCGNIKKAIVNADDIKGFGIFADTNIKKLDIKSSKDVNFPSGTGDVETMYVSKSVKTFLWSPFDEEEHYFSSGAAGKIKRLVVEGKNTNIKDWWSKYQSIGKLYTVKGAKAIKWAKKNKIKYKVVSKAKLKKLCKG